MDQVRRQEQVSKKSNEKSEKVQQERVLATLPQLSDQIESYAIIKRKTTFSMQDLVRNLTRAPIRGTMFIRTQSLDVCECVRVLMWNLMVV